MADRQKGGRAPSQSFRDQLYNIRTRQSSGSTSCYSRVLPVPPSTNQPAAPSQYSVMVPLGRQTGHERWYHGMIGVQDTIRLLKNPGEFLVRRSELVRGDRSRHHFIISYMVQTGEVRHKTIEQSADRKYYIWPHGHKWAKSFDSLRSLVRYYMHSKRAITEDNAQLVVPVLRDDWELDHNSILKGTKLGEGAYGAVYEGKLQRPGDEPIEVAIKESHNLDKEGVEQLLKEARIMFTLKHRNVVRVLGVAATQMPVCMVLELVRGCTLHVFVQDQTNTHSISTLIRLCHGVASGLTYLHANNIVHRDISARNCLVTRSTSHRHRNKAIKTRGKRTMPLVKIADFGLAAACGADQKLNKMIKWPIRWLAPETLTQNREFGKPSDVWAYGVLLWEVFSGGRDPYPEQATNKDVMKLVKGGGRMEERECANVPKEMKALLFECWKTDPALRPSMVRVKELIHKYHSQYVRMDTCSVLSRSTASSARDDY